MTGERIFAEFAGVTKLMKRMSPIKSLSVLRESLPWALYMVPVVLLAGSHD
jgi:hypothetical protein